MCVSKNHITGWKVVKVKQGTYVSYMDSIYGRTINCTFLYLRCRTDHCIENKVERVNGHWELKHFEDTVSK